MEITKLSSTWEYWKGYTIKKVEIKEKDLKKKYLRKTRKIVETKQQSRNLVKGIHARAVPVVRYSALFIKGRGEELQQMYQRTRKLMTRHDIDSLYVSRKGER